MPLRTTVPLTEQLLSVISGVEDFFDAPRSMRQLVYRQEYEHRKLAKRRGDRIRRERKRIHEALWRLEKAEWVTARKGAKGMREYRLTPEGWLVYASQYAKRLARRERAVVAAPSLRKGSYVIIFDVPETCRGFRDTFRRVLYNLGCTPLQKSIYLTRDAKTTRFIARIVVNCELQDRVKILFVNSIL